MASAVVQAIVKASSQTSKVIGMVKF